MTQNEEYRRTVHRALAITDEATAAIRKAKRIAKEEESDYPGLLKEVMWVLTANAKSERTTGKSEDAQ